MRKILILFITLLSINSATYGQQSSNWDKWNWLIGTWIGEGSGNPGQGGGKFSFSLDLDKKILISASKKTLHFLKVGLRKRQVQGLRRPKIGSLLFVNDQF
jgi:hypothetical protein